MCAERNEPLVPCWSFPDAGTTVSRLPRGLGDIRVEGAGKNRRENYAATRTAQCINNNHTGREKAKDEGRRRFIRGLRVQKKKEEEEKRKVTPRDGGDGQTREGRNVNHASNAE